MILVVGATGQLGSLVVRRLAEEGRPVRAMVRRPDAAADLAAAGAELVTADLRHPGTLEAAVAGADAVVATANTVAPSRSGDTQEAEIRGYAELIERAQRAGVRRFVFASVPTTPVDEAVPQIRAKRRTEEALAASALSWVSLRLPPYIEVWLALVGSSVPLRGEQRPTASRPYPFLQRFRRLTGRSVEDRGLMLVPGPATARHAFISVHDVARLMAAAVDADDLTGPVEAGGPEILSWGDVARIYGEVLGRRVRILSTPVPVYAVAQTAMAPVAPAAANIMGLNRYVGSAETPIDSSELARRLRVEQMATVEQVLRAKSALPTAVAGR